MEKIPTPIDYQRFQTILKYSETFFQILKGSVRVRFQKIFKDSELTREPRYIFKKTDMEEKDF